MKELFLIPLLPLIGSAVVYFVGGAADKTTEQRRKLSCWLAVGFSLSSFLLVLKVFSGMGDAAISYTAWRWFNVGSLQVDFGLRFDNLSAVMSLIITGVGTLIHLYSIGYMAEDASRPRFFSYLNLFLFSMLILVLGDNLLMTFVGWEGVGLCSYLLIGFWYKNAENPIAGQKAFIVNRIGDAGFLLGIFTLIMAAGTINYSELAAVSGSLSPAVIGAATLLLFVGACGKSAQIPLFVWLPDAMAGPTPVSALIHAATMVTAGVYLIARMGVLFAAAPPEVGLVILLIGTATAFFGASVALVQNDIKKVLAYSTVSQLGFMFMAMGVGAFSTGLFHVVTHAFFKACLFMAAGSVIIGCHHVQDMREYGGLRKRMPLTFLAYLAGTVAIAGLPFTSGFFSKDGILWSVYSASGEWPVLFGLPANQLCWGLGVLTAFLTAFYMGRSLMMTFFGSYRGHEHPHESPWVVCVPILILGVLSVVFGFLFGDKFIYFLDEWTRSDLKGGHHHLVEHYPMYKKLEYFSMAVAVGAFMLSIAFYSVLSGLPQKISKFFGSLTSFLSNKWYVDELYSALVTKPLRALSAFFFMFVDRGLIDGVVNFAGEFTLSQGRVLSNLQTGKVRNYAGLMVGGVISLAAAWIFGVI